MGTSASTRTRATKVGEERRQDGSTDPVNASEIVELDKALRIAIRADYERASNMRRKQLGRLYRDTQKVQRSESAALAQMQFKNAKAIMDARLAQPRLVIREAMAHFPPGFSFEWTKEQLREAILWVKMLEQSINPPPYRPPFKDPGIWTMQSSVVIGLQLTIPGIGFGATQGTVTLTTCTGTTYDLTVVAWSDDAIQVEVPENIVGIPYDCLSTIEVRRPDGKTARHSIYVEPTSNSAHCTDPFQEADSTVFGTYSEYHTFKSAPLPSSYRMPAVRFIFERNYVYPYDVDAPTRVSIVSGPQQVGDHLEVQTHLWDDHHWDFRVDAEFSINVPSPTVGQIPGWTLG